MMTKLNAWSVETRAPWERNGGHVSVLRVGNQNTERKNPGVPDQRDGRSGSDSALAAGMGRERESEGIWFGSFPFFFCPSPMTASSSPPLQFSPLHSVLSSRCQEVAQCLFFFSFERLHVFTRLILILVFSSAPGGADW